MKKSLIVLTILMAVSMSFAANRLNAEWEYLFNGKDLDGWVQRNGEAQYKVVDGEIVGTTVLTRPTHFYAPKTAMATLFSKLNFLLET